ncbi:hypothetical protein DSO57_1032534 [Entomophthora muscae]|uniref:Uncharacterized protein n=1 Tax=Entomophthora muscae TaxID=34485 RepID=A0ACC2TB54_9FUNG|nr:hypothetical protein DSO57_1032534 [Entomophthora muscae]
MPQLSQRRHEAAGIEFGIQVMDKCQFWLLDSGKDVVFAVQLVHRQHCHYSTVLTHSRCDSHGAESAARGTTLSAVGNVSALTQYAISHRGSKLMPCTNTSCRFNPTATLNMTYASNAHCTTNACPTHHALLGKWTSNANALAADAIASPSVSRTDTRSIRCRLYHMPTKINKDNIPPTHATCPIQQHSDVLNCRRIKLLHNHPSNPSPHLSCPTTSCSTCPFPPNHNIHYPLHFHLHTSQFHLCSESAFKPRNSLSLISQPFKDPCILTAFENILLLLIAQSGYSMNHH